MSGLRWKANIEIGVVNFVLGGISHRLDSAKSDIPVSALAVHTPPYATQADSSPMQC
jgi:hypothetical protein